MAAAGAAPAAVWAELTRTGPGGGRAVITFAAPDRRPAPRRPGGRPPAAALGHRDRGRAGRAAGRDAGAGVVQGSGWLGYAVGRGGRRGGHRAAAAPAGRAAGRRRPVPRGAGAAHRAGSPTTACWACCPGRRAVGRLGELINGAGRQISLEIAPVAATPEILVLVTAAFGLLAVAVHLAAVSAGRAGGGGRAAAGRVRHPGRAGRRAAAGAAPWSAAAAGYGLLLLTGAGARSPSRGALLRRLPAAVALVAVAVAAGRRARLRRRVHRHRRPVRRRLGGRHRRDRAQPVHRAARPADRRRPGRAAAGARPRAAGLPARADPERVRARTPAGGRPGRRPGCRCPDRCSCRRGTPGDVADLQIENVGLYDYWLPLYGEPLAVDGLPAAQWAYDQRSGTGYTLLPRQDESWQERALLPGPTAAELRRVTAAPRQPRPATTA